MRLIITLALISLLSGCSLTPPKFDNNEYYIVARIDAISKLMHDECDNRQRVEQYIEQLKLESQTLSTYTFYLPHHTDLFEISKILVEDVDELSAKYQQNKEPSLEYCKLKTQSISLKVRRTLQTIGNLGE